MPEIINHGVIEGQRASDYVAGTLPYEVRNPTGDWTPYLPQGEWQRNSWVDTQACVTFSALNSLEAQYKLLTGIERNFSDRFTAKMSGTTQDGNWLFKVGDSIKRDGLVDESIWPAPLNFTWEEYYTPPTIDVINKGRDFLKDWSVCYEFIDATSDSIKYHLKQSPIQIVIPGHAVVEFYNENQVEKYFDSYAPFIKDRTQLLSSALKYVLTKKQKSMTADEVKKQYVLSFYREPSMEELAYWTGKSLIEFLNTAIKDRGAFLTSESQ